MGALAIEAFTNEISLVRKILDLCGLFTIIFPTTVVTLFCLIALIVSMHLTTIHSHLRNDQSIIDYKALMILKGQHLLICQIVDRINQCLGLALLMEFIFTLVGMTNNLMHILVSISKMDWHMVFLSLIFCVDQIILQLFPICITADRIVNQVRVFYRLYVVPVLKFKK